MYFWSLFPSSLFSGVKWGGNRSRASACFPINLTDGLVCHSCLVSTESAFSNDDKNVWLISEHKKMFFMVNEDHEIFLHTLSSNKVLTCSSSFDTVSPYLCSCELWPLSQIVFKALNPAASWLPRIPFNRSQRLSLIWLPVTAGVYALVRWGVEVSQPSSWLLTVGNRHNFLFFWFVVLSPPVLAYITHLLSVIQIQKSCCLYDTSIFNCRRQIPL